MRLTGVLTEGDLALGRRLFSAEERQADPLSLLGLEAEGDLVRVPLRLGVIEGQEAASDDAALVGEEVVGVKRRPCPLASALGASEDWRRWCASAGGDLPALEHGGHG